MSHIHEKFGIFQYAHFELPLKNIHEIMPEASLELFRIFWFLAIRREIRPFLDMPKFFNGNPSTSVIAFSRYSDYLRKIAVVLDEHGIPSTHVSQQM